MVSSVLVAWLVCFGGNGGMGSSVWVAWLLCFGGNGGIGSSVCVLTSRNRQLAFSACGTGCTEVIVLVGALGSKLAKLWVREKLI